jgi:hypothetical protein
MMMLSRLVVMPIGSPRSPPIPRARLPYHAAYHHLTTESRFSTGGFGRCNRPPLTSHSRTVTPATCANGYAPVSDLFCAKDFHDSIKLHFPVHLPHERTERRMGSGSVRQTPHP